MGKYLYRSEVWVVLVRFWLSHFSNWLQITVSYRWTCLTSHLVIIENLSLSNNDLEGGIPSEFGLLEKLSKFCVTSFNYLSWKTQFFSSCKVKPSKNSSPFLVAVLKVDSNRLTGSIPVELTNLTNLMTLKVNGNDITGTVPSSFCEIEMLAISADCGESPGYQVNCTCCSTCFWWFTM